MKKGLFAKIFLAYGILLLLSLAFIELYITSAVRENHIDDLKKSLAMQISLLSDTVPFSQAGLDEVARRIKGKTGARVTLIAADGKVLGDSDGDSSRMDNHASRDEIRGALTAGRGSSIRYSDTMKHDFLYVAGKVDSGTGAGGFIRLAVPLKEVNDTANLLRMKIIFVVSTGLVVTVLISAWLIMMLRNLVAQLGDFSRSLAVGELGKRLFLQGGTEFGAIAGDLTILSERLQSMITENEEEKNRLSVILRSIPDALLIIDASGTVQLSNEAAPEFFGPGPFAGRQFMEVVRSHEFGDLMDEVRAGTQSGRAEFSIDTPSTRVLSVTVSPLFYRGDSPSGFVAVFHDVTQARRLEEVRKDFVANVSHELKTPITAIKGFSDTLLDGAIDDREHALKFLKTIKANSERINSLVDDLMTISKIELGVIKVEKAVVPIDDVLEHVAATLGAKAAEKDLALSFSITPGSGAILADRDRLIQIFTNLVDNAIKFTEAGSVTFGIAADGEKTFLFVEDTGPGIPQKHLPRLGERFYRVDAARSRKMGGTGLGLAIVKHLVRAHGWEMQIESTLGKGTRVRIFLAP